MDQTQEPSILKSVFKFFLSLFIFLIVATILVYLFIIRSPHFTPPVVVTIEPGQGIGSATRELKEKKIIRSSSFAETLVILFGGSRKIHAGVYEFKEQQNVFLVVSRIVKGELGYTPVKLTIPEGTDAVKIAEIIKQKFPNIDLEETKASLLQKEGYLFPDTYLFAPFTDSLKIQEKLRKTFDEKTKSLNEKINQSGRTLDEVVKLASILEEEVQTKEDMAMVADIMLRRMKMGMPLQVDCTLKYVLNKTSAQLTIADLRADGPFNSYTRKGLPPTPISNPGLGSINAALNPIPNPYLFYLSDKDGITHFAKTYEEHLQNKRKYLN